MERITGIKTIAFDADQTLWDFQKVMRHSLRCALFELEKADIEAASMLDIEKMIEIRDRVAQEMKNMASHEAVRLEAFRQTLVEIGRPNDSLAVHLHQVYMQHRFEDIELYEDVLPTLTILRESYKLGMLSNGNSEPARCGLDGIFTFVVFSQDWGVEKPAPEFYRIATEEAGCSKEELLNVGDSLYKDVIGAANAGIRSVWLNRKNSEIPPGIKVDYEIHSLTELLKIL